MIKVGPRTRMIAKSGSSRSLIHLIAESYTNGNASFFLDCSGKTSHRLSEIDLNHQRGDGLKDQ